MELVGIIDYRKGSGLTMLSLSLVLTTIGLSFVAAYFTVIQHGEFVARTFFPIVLLILASIFLVSLVFQCILSMLFGGGKVTGLYRGGVTEVCFSTPIQRNSFLLAHFLANFLPVVITAPVAIFHWNGYTCFCLCACVANLLAYMPLYFLILKQKSTHHLRFERDGVLRIYTTKD